MLTDQQDCARRHTGDRSLVAQTLVAHLSSSEGIDVDQHAAKQTAELHWALAAAGLADLVWGHGAIRAEDGEGFYLKSSGWAFEEVDSDKVVKVSWDGELIEGAGSVHLEVPIHSAIMRARADVGAVVHSHSPSVNAFASLDAPLRAISHDGVFFADDLPQLHQTSDLIRTPELGEQLAETLESSRALIIPQHGFVTVGSDAAEAAMMAFLLARSCQTYLDAAACGGPRAWSGPDEVAIKREIAFRPFGTGYRYLVRKGRALHDALAPDEHAAP